MNLHDVIKYPYLSEKSSKNYDQGIYVFAVDKRTNKAEVKHVVEFIFKVKVAKVNIIPVRKKPKKVGKFAGFKSAYKKAIVTLQDGYSIQIFKEKEPEIDSNKNIENKKVNKETELKIKEIEKRAAEKIAAKAKTEKTALKETVNDDQEEKSEVHHQDEEK